MKILTDTSVIVQLDRNDEYTREVMKKISKTHSLYLSTISVSEILTGSYLRDDYIDAVKKAKSLMGQFVWIDLDPEIAEKVGELNAYLISKGQKIELPDVIIAATYMLIQADYLLSFNTRHFKRYTFLQGKTFTPQEFTDSVILAENATKPSGDPE